MMVQYHPGYRALFPSLRPVSTQGPGTVIDVSASERRCHDRYQAEGHQQKAHALHPDEKSKIITIKFNKITKKTIQNSGGNTIRHYWADSCKYNIPGKIRKSLPGSSLNGVWGILL